MRTRVSDGFFSGTDRILFPVLLFCCLFGVLGTSLQAATEEVASRMEDGWREASIFLFQQAHETFADQAPEVSTDRERKLGLAVTRLALQPRTQGNIAEAARELTELMKEDATDASGRAAQFYLARVYEVHEAPAEREKARELFYDLASRHPGDLFTELAAVRVLSIELENAADSGEDPAAVVSRLAPLAKNLTSDTGRREYHANAGLMLAAMQGDRSTALRELEVAASYPGGLPQIRALILLSAATLAQELGEFSTARTFYLRFIDEFPREFRRYSVQKILETLPEQDKKPEQSPPDSNIGG